MRTLADSLAPSPCYCYSMRASCDGVVASASPAAAAVIAACHSLVCTDNDELVGDPIELSAIRSLQWTYDAKSATARPPSGLAKVNKKDPKKKTVAPAKSEVIVNLPASVKIVQRHHFSSALQRMSVVAEVADHSGGKQLVALVKGSPEAVMALLEPGTFEKAGFSTAAFMEGEGRRERARETPKNGANIFKIDSES